MTATRFPHFVRGLATTLTASVLAAVLALASQLALAHGGHHHGLQAAPPPAGSGQPIIAAEGIGPSPVQAVWSDSCPDGSGGDCCCKRQPVSAGTAKAAIVNSGGWTRPEPLPSERPAGSSPEFLSVSPVSRALSRAPPYFS